MNAFQDVIIKVFNKPSILLKISNDLSISLLDEVNLEVSQMSDVVGPMFGGIGSQIAFISFGICYDYIDGICRGSPITTSFGLIEKMKLRFAVQRFKPASKPLETAIVVRSMNLFQAETSDYSEQFFEFTIPGNLVLQNKTNCKEVISSTTDFPKLSFESYMYAITFSESLTKDDYTLFYQTLIGKINVMQGVEDFTNLLNAMRISIRSILKQNESSDEVVGNIKLLVNALTDPASLTRGSLAERLRRRGLGIFHTRHPLNWIVKKDIAITLYSMIGLAYGISNCEAGSECNELRSKLFKHIKVHLEYEPDISKIEEGVILSFKAFKGTNQKSLSTILNFGYAKIGYVFLESTLINENYGALNQSDIDSFSQKSVYIIAEYDAGSLSAFNLSDNTSTNGIPQFGFSRISIVDDQHSIIEIKDLVDGVQIVIPLPSIALKYLSQDIEIIDSSESKVEINRLTCYSVSDWVDSSWNRDCKISYLNFSNGFNEISENLFSPLSVVCTCYHLSYFGVGLASSLETKVQIDETIRFYKYSLLWTLVAILLVWIYITTKEALSKKNKSISAYREDISIIDYKIPITSIFKEDTCKDMEVLYYFTKLSHLHVEQQVYKISEGVCYSERLIDPIFIINKQQIDDEESNTEEVSLIGRSTESLTSVVSNDKQENQPRNGKKRKNKINANESQEDDENIPQKITKFNPKSDAAYDQREDQEEDFNGEKGIFYKGYKDPIRHTLKLFVKEHEFLGLFLTKDPFNPRLIRLLYLLCKYLGFYFFQSFFYTFVFADMLQVCFWLIQGIEVFQGITDMATCRISDKLHCHILSERFNLEKNAFYLLPLSVDITINC